jgi:hypothetical protein
MKIAWTILAYHGFYNILYIQHTEMILKIIFYTTK